MEYKPANGYGICRASSDLEDRYLCCKCEGNDEEEEVEATRENSSVNYYRVFVYRVIRSGPLRVDRREREKEREGAPSNLIASEKSRPLYGKETTESSRRRWGQGEENILRCPSRTGLTRFSVCYCTV